MADKLTIEETKEMLYFRDVFTLHRAEQNIPYWKKIGITVLDDSLAQKWCEFVDKNSKIVQAIPYIDLIIQFASLIKTGVSLETIRDILESHSDREIIIMYLGEFFHPEIVSQLTSRVK